MTEEEAIELEEVLEKKNKIMRAMAKAILKNEIVTDKLCKYERNEKCKKMSCEDCIIEYFEKKGKQKMNILDIALAISLVAPWIVLIIAIIFSFKN